MPTLSWQDTSPRTEQAFSGTWPGPLFSLSPSITRGEGFTLTTQLPLRIPAYGACPTAQKAKDTAQRLFDRFLASIAPTGSSSSATATLRRVLEALAPAPGDDGRPNDATHANLATALASTGTLHRETADSGGEYVVVDLCDSHVMHVHNPLGPDYGFDWDITDASRRQALTGTLRLGAADTAHRIRLLLSLLH
ncbi:hypothetical protein ACFRJ3_41205 [Streptomyces sp. NPDC056696]|uniref:hypothetical protein n=1 Tax=Streptomyces sp. NPDC056696 TaxID=3345914 RepID=UPI0036BC63A9